ncbi:hypothetical protein VE01_03326 [Pseudogymnoascus verrucosus]|uniref:Uncharacterized protein n=1 Tax=Pseudogymnoascus verrucosus TaxID=342668 RepID=A0A1B8GSR0_9PEZI|nr:uncharacterized protein VE01_03326 [Pseudogymnoascus verrucosus]OBT98872.1 hypothetical protein VE01_03326 [Pseudogymnoascus verrucosus]
MGWFDGASEVASSYILDGYGYGGRAASPSRSSRHGGHKKHKSHKSKTETGSAFGDWAAGVSGGGVPRGGNRSTTSFFSVGSGARSATSSYRRSPRRGLLSRTYSRLRHLLRKLLHFLKTHPLKVFMLVIMPLITGGALTGLLARFGIRLPAGLGKLAKMAGVGGGGGGVKGGRGGLEALGGVGGMMDGLGGVMSVAKLFI